MFSEKLFEDILVRHPQLIEVQLNLIGRQVNYFGKRIDLLFQDRFNEKLIIELKKDNLTRNALSQVLEYEGYILSEKDPSARVMLIANRIPLNLKKAMDHHGIEYKEITKRALLTFLHDKDIELFKIMESAIMEKDVSNNSSLINQAMTSKEIVGTVTNVKAKKDSKDRFEIWFKRSYENLFPYGKTYSPEGIKIKIRLDNQIYTIGFHNTKTLIWLSARNDRDGYNLTDVLKSNGIMSNQKLLLKQLEDDIWEITEYSAGNLKQLTELPKAPNRSRRGMIIELISQGHSDQEILRRLDIVFPPGYFKTTNKQAISGTKRDLEV